MDSYSRKNSDNFTGSMKAYLEGVKEEMYRTRNLRPVCDDFGQVNERLASPLNNPDSETPERNLVFLHGANVTCEDSAAWFSEVFKRLWQSGANVRFHGVTWCSDKGPAEAYDPDPSLRVPQLVHEDWEDYPTNSWASNWHKLFADSPNDGLIVIGIATLSAAATTAPAVTFKNLPTGAKVVVKPNGYNVPSEAFMGWGEGGVFSLALNPEVVTPKIGELDAGEPFVVGEGAVTVAVKAILGLKYELRRGVKIGSGGIIDPALLWDPVIATGTRVTLSDDDPPADKAFYRVVVKIEEF